MKKIFLGLSLISSIQAYSMAEGNFWKGAPRAIRTTTGDKEVLTALKNVSVSLQKLAALYAEKVGVALTPEQKNHGATMLGMLKKIIMNAKLLSEQGNDARLEQETQALVQEFYVACLPLMLMIEQEKSSPIENQQLAQYGYDTLMRIIDAMLKNLA